MKYPSAQTWKNLSIEQQCLIEMMILWRPVRPIQHLLAFTQN